MVYIPYDIYLTNFFQTKNALANKDPNGDHIATPSFVCIVRY